nr:L-seryl-tRNA(Sec) selenium transferase [Desulfobulbaceae bacterium]
GHEPTVSEVVSSGVDVVTFSGDKLLGGPQAGLIVGTKDIIAKIKKNPMNRALRIDKFTLAGLEATLRLYYDQLAVFKTIPTLAMLSAPLEAITKKACRLVRQIKKPLAESCYVYTIDTESKVGGGAMPERNLPTKAVALKPFKLTVNELEESLRKQRIPVIGRIENDQFILDMRTVSDREIVELATCLIGAFVNTKL